MRLMLPLNNGTVADVTHAPPWQPTPDELDRFREVQQLAYRGAEEVAGGLEPGITEKETAGRMRTWLQDRGVEDWFHLPFAWFGDRTAFRNFRQPFQFFPTGRRLEEGMPYILDCAPVRDGFTADIGYAGSLGPNAVLDRIVGDLAEHRRLILNQVRDRRPLREIYEAVDRLAARQGFDNRHRAYPFRVIAHQVHRLPPGRGPVVGRFGLRSLRQLARTVRVGMQQGWSPLWADGRFSNHPPTPGLWAVEPHLGLRGVGAKFEELLVVTNDDAFWLDDDLPHVRRWAAPAAHTEVQAVEA
jgi:Xaa-Pro aminopeptidase